MASSLHTLAAPNMVDLPDYLQKYQKSPEEILGKRLLPPPGPTGRSLGAGTRKFASAEALQYSIDLYFQRCEVEDEDGNKEEPTVPDMIYAIGLSSKAALKKYREYGEDYEQVIDRALLKMEGKRNRQLLKGGNTTPGVIFDLKNHHGWSEKSETTTTVVPGGSLADLLKSLDGKVLRPAIEYEQAEEIEFEEVVENASPQMPNRAEYAEPAQFEDDELC
jgi:hypothetical protein